MSKKFLPLLLGEISRMPTEKGLTLTQIARKFGKTKQSLNYHIREAQDKGLIERIQSYPYSVYKLTSKGERVKEILVQSHPNQNKHLWKAHNLIIGFKITSFGRFRFTPISSGKIIQMNNWRYMRFEHNGFVVCVQDTGLLKIYCPSRYTTNPDIEFGKMYSEATRLAQEYCDRYDMRLGEIRTIRKGQKSLYNSQKLAEITGRFKRDDIWVDASEGTDELEEPQDSNKIEDLMEMPNRITRIEGLMERQAGLIETYAKHLNAHIPVLKGMDRLLKRLEKALSQKRIGDYV